LASVPSIDAEPSGAPAAANQRLNDIELRLLDEGAKAKENLNRKADQRFMLRWLAVGTAMFLIIAMLCMLFHVVHQLLFMHAFKAPPILLVATYVAPIVSMTTLAIALMVAAFRGFKDGDEVTGMSAIAEGAKATSITS
jgi:hypothetical protein